MTSPTQRTLAECKRRGWTTQVVETWNQYARRRIDLFGCIDVLALVPEKRVAAWGACCLYKMPYGYRGEHTCMICQRTSGNVESPGYQLGIQTTAGSGHSARRTKILDEPRMRQWLETGARLEIWSWAKQGARGKRKVWTLRVEEITLEMFEQKARAA